MLSNTLRVLCVDDNQDTAESTGLLLALAGADVRVCYDGASALAEVKKFKPDVAILDLEMPRADGCAVARLLRTEPRNKPLFLVAITGQDHDEARRRTAEAGFDQHLTKPADPHVLLKLLEDFSAPGRDASV